jgi:hypothetical protein
MFFNAFTMVSLKELNVFYIFLRMFISSENSIDMSSFAKVMHHAMPPKI